MNSSLKLSTYFLLIILQILDNNGRSVLPSRCHQRSPTPAPRCRFGAELDECGKVIKCLRGPGEFCGESYGPCMENLQCSFQGRCEGCSFLTFTCWEQNDDNTHNSDNPEGYPIDMERIG